MLRVRGIGWTDLVEDWVSFLPTVFDMPRYRGYTEPYWQSMNIEHKQYGAMVSRLKWGEKRPGCKYVFFLLVLISIKKKWKIMDSWFLLAYSKRVYPLILFIGEVLTLCYFSRIRVYTAAFIAFISNMRWVILDYNVSATTIIIWPVGICCLVASQRRVKRKHTTPAGIWTWFAYFIFRVVNCTFSLRIIPDKIQKNSCDWDRFYST